MQKKKKKKRLKIDEHFIPFLTFTLDTTFYPFLSLLALQMQHSIPFLTCTPNAKIYLCPYLHFKCNILSLSFHSRCNILFLSLLALQMKNYINFLTCTSNATFYPFPFLTSTLDATFYPFPYLHSRCKIISFSLFSL